MALRKKLLLVAPRVADPYTLLSLTARLAHYLAHVDVRRIAIPVTPDLAESAGLVGRGAATERNRRCRRRSNSRDHRQDPIRDHRQRDRAGSADERRPRLLGRSKQEPANRGDPSRRDFENRRPASTSTGCTLGPMAAGSPTSPRYGRARRADSTVRKRSFRRANRSSARRVRRTRHRHRPISACSAGRRHVRIGAHRLQHDDPRRRVDGARPAGHRHVRRSDLPLRPVHVRARVPTRALLSRRAVHDFTIVTLEHFAELLRSRLPHLSDRIVGVRLGKPSWPQNYDLMSAPRRQAVSEHPDDADAAAGRDVQPHDRAHRVRRQGPVRDVLLAARQDGAVRARARRDPTSPSRVLRPRL